MNDPSKAPPRKIVVALGQTVRDFMQINGLRAEAGRVDVPETNHYDIAVDRIVDTDAIVFGDHWIALEARAGSRSIELPPGRILFIRQSAGRINGWSFTLFAKASPLMETNRLVKTLFDQLLAQGWKPEANNSLRFALTDDDPDFKLSGDKIYGQLVDEAGNLISVTVSNLASAPSQPTHIIVPGPARPASNPPVYLVRIGFYWAKRMELSYGDLIYPRRLFVNGDKNEHLPLRAWIEDPDWTPQQHGMVDLGGTGENKKWSVPGRPASGPAPAR